MGQGARGGGEGCRRHRAPRWVGQQGAAAGEGGGGRRRLKFCFYFNVSPHPYQNIEND